MERPVRYGTPRRPLAKLHCLHVNHSFVAHDRDQQQVHRCQNGHDCADVTDPWLIKINCRISAFRSPFHQPELSPSSALPISPGRDQEEPGHKDCRQNQKSHDPDVRGRSEFKKTQYQEGQDQKSTDSRESSAQEGDPVRPEQFHERPDRFVPTSHHEYSPLPPRKTAV